MGNRERREPIPCPDCNGRGWEAKGDPVSGQWQDACERCEGTAEWRPTPAMMEHIIAPREGLSVADEVDFFGQAYRLIPHKDSAAEQPLSDDS